MTAVGDYLDELSGHLRGGRRTRILAEVRAHLVDAAAAEILLGADPDRAAALAVERFGPPARVARQFNALRRRPRAIAQRAAAVMLATAATASLGTATVWAFAPGGSHGHARRHHQAQPAHVRIRR
jgi:hypothetical protein